MRSTSSRTRKSARSAAALAALVVLAAVCVPRAAPADPLGEATFSACAVCHAVGPGAQNGVGPHLNALDGRKAGELDGFAYSDAMRGLGARGIAWTAETLDAFLADPQSFVPGTRMSMRGVADNRERAALVRYLLSPHAAPAPGADATLAAAEDAPALALAGDHAYGEYLASQCVTCHQESGHAEGIPSIIAWPSETFIRALYAYKSGLRRHEVMAAVAGALGDEEIAALAAHFGSLEPH